LISANDIFIVFSHRGTKTFSIQSLDIAKKWSFGLEQFLHGPRATLDKQSSLVAFTSMIEPRKDSLIRYAETIGAEVVEINEKTFNGVSKEFTWLAQLLYGQQLALELSKRLATNPDSVRSDQSPYKEARHLLTL
jgi:fructoselysine-6-P-deglycase FrlB-like protein